MPIMKWETAVLSFLRKHLLAVVIILSTLASLLARWYALSFVSPDMDLYLLPWFNTIREQGGLPALAAQVGNYSIPYQTLIAFLTYIKADPVHLIKISSTVFDYLLAFAVARLVFCVTESKTRSAVAYTAAVFHPVLFLNSALWGQCDAIFTFFCVLSLLFYIRRKDTLCFVALGIAFAFKLQAVFLLPFYLVMYFTKRRFSLLNLLWIPVCMIVLSLGGLIAGRSFSSVFTIYSGQVGTYHSLSNNYPSLWNLVVDYYSEDYYTELHMFCILLTVSAMAAGVVWLTKSRVSLTPRHLPYLAFILAYTCVFFLPNMHERYSFIFIVLGLVVLFIDRKTLPAYAGLVCLDLQTYGKFLFESTIMLWILLVIANIACYIYYVCRFLQYIRRESSC